MAGERGSDGHDERRSDERVSVALRVDYHDADDLLADYTENLSTGGACVASARLLPEGTEVRLALSFPALIEPIRVDGIVRWARTSPEPMLGIEFPDPSAREQLAEVIARVREKDPKVVKRTLRVLVVEDNPHVAELLRHAFGDTRSLGPNLAVDCQLASDGRAALALLREQKFDAIIVDVYLPVLDGASLITIVRKELRERLPIIAVSAGGESAHRMAMEAGADIFIDKPMRLRSVMETMRSVMKL
ncbi:MAG TPA: response regulator [Kofleriaceae bacterium]|nr:response regulator [Kofleriaceae bacterium]